MFIGSVYGRTTAQKLCANVRSHGVVCGLCGPDTPLPGWTPFEAATQWLQTTLQKTSCEAARTLLSCPVWEALAAFEKVLKGIPATKLGVKRAKNKARGLLQNDKVLAPERPK